MLVWFLAAPPGLRREELLARTEVGGAPIRGGLAGPLRAATSGAPGYGLKARPRRAPGPAHRTARLRFSFTEFARAAPKCWSGYCSSDILHANGVTAYQPTATRRRKAPRNPIPPCRRGSSGLSVHETYAEFSTGLSPNAFRKFIRALPSGLAT